MIQDLYAHCCLVFFMVFAILCSLSFVLSFYCGKHDVNKMFSKKQRNKVFAFEFFFEVTSKLFCTGKSARQLTNEEVSITNCKKGRCRLRKNTKVSIELKLQPG